MTDEIPQWALKRAYDLIDREPFDTLGRVFDRSVARAFARYIAEHEEPPVDPDLLLAREACANLLEENNIRQPAADLYRGGEYDDTANILLALKTIRLYRERHG